MCSQDNLKYNVDTPAAAAAPPAAVPPPARKLRSLAELRCDLWKRTTAKLAREFEDSSAQPASQPKVEEEKPRLRQLEDLASRFEQRSAADDKHRYSREVLLIARLGVPRGIRCTDTSAEPVLTVLPKASRYTQDTQLDKKKLLAQMEMLLDKETGADVLNTANERLHAAPLKSLKDCASTAAGSRTHSEAPSSERSSEAARSPRSPRKALTRHVFSANAAPFIPTAGLLTQAPFIPTAGLHTQAYEA